MRTYLRARLRHLAGRYLQFWARLVIRRHRPLVVGITGSVGKTTTKEMLGAVLMHPDTLQYIGVVAKSQGSNNNATSLPGTVLRGRFPVGTLRAYLRVFLAAPMQALRVLRSKYPDVLVLEYGAGGPGSIATLTRVAQPSVAVVTNVGPTHLEKLGTVERVAEEKAALIRDVPPTGLVVLGSHNAYTAAMGSQTRAAVVYAEGRGRELAENVARAVGRHFGLPDDLIERALRTAGAVKGRQDAAALVLPRIGGITLIDDSYNASPLSMELGLDLLAARKDGARRVAVLGVMAELGERSEAYHADVGAYARPRVDLLVGVGEAARRYDPDHWYPTSDECAAHLPSHLRDGDIVWVKGSNVARMKNVVAALQAAAAGSPAEPAGDPGRSPVGPGRPLP